MVVSKYLAVTVASLSISLGACASSHTNVGTKIATSAPIACGHTTRVHYIAADSVAWNYATTGSNQITGAPFGDHENTYVKRGPDRIGSTYLKSLYREYTDGSFTKLVPRTAEWQHLGDLGPVIHAEVGDTINVVFKNNTPFPASMHPHGVEYAKDSEGAPYADGTSGKDKLDDGVPQGGSHTYIWHVPARSGPAPMEGSSSMWMYHSHVDEAGDTYAGLMGPIIVTRCGMARADGSPKDVDRELVMNFMVADENQSLWLTRNINKYAENPSSVNPDDEDFGESNLMHSINGYVFGNQPMPFVRKGQRVRWYVMAMGTEVDLHTPHWHGNTVVANGMRTDVISLLPASMVTADMQPDDVGIWLFHCHVSDHIKAGMMTRYQVTD